MSGGPGIHSVEMIFKNGSTCSFPDLPFERYRHSQNGLVVCGGDSAGSDSCSTFTDGAWMNISHNLAVQRRGHVSWTSADGIFLIGGDDTDAKNTTELLSATSSSTTPSFQLAFNVGRYNLNIRIKSLNQILSFFSGACSIEVPSRDSVIITGGHITSAGSSFVYVYTNQGYKQRLPDLQEPRYFHTCGFYHDSNDQMVSNNS